MKNKLTIAIMVSVMTLPLFGCGHRHTYSLVKAAPSNCTYHGTSTDYYKCEGCGKYFDLDKNEIDITSIELPLGDHVYTYRIERNYHVKYCEICGHVDGEGQPHVYSEKAAEERFVKEAATCVSHASYYVSCICGKSSSGTTEEDSFVDVNGPLGDHKYIYHEKVAPVNEDDGYEEYYTCEYCDLLFDGNKRVIDSVPVIPASAEISLTNKYNGAEIDVLYSRAREFLQTDNPARYLYTATAYRFDGSNPIKLSWNFNNATGPFTLEIAKDANFENIVLSYPFNNKNVTSMDICNLVPGTTYYYHLAGKNYTCKADSFTVAGGVRAINTDNTILNMRDLGGYTTEDGKTVNYEYLYRSATWLVSSSALLDYRLKELGMKTELDLRRDTNTTSQHPVDGINFVKYGIGQYTQVLPEGKNGYYGAYENMGNLFNFLANESNYPITYHCNAGADRTGTLSFLILGLLGVGYEDICRDYELTSIFYDKRWRSEIEYVDGDYAFTSSGIMQEDAANFVAFDLLYNTMMEKYGDSSNKLSKAVEKYLTTVCGVSSTNISKIRNILLSD